MCKTARFELIKWFDQEISAFLNWAYVNFRGTYTQTLAETYHHDIIMPSDELIESCNSDFEFCSFFNFYLVSLFRGVSGELHYRRCSMNTRTSRRILEDVDEWFTRRELHWSSSLACKTAHALRDSPTRQSHKMANSSELVALLQNACKSYILACSDWAAQEIRISERFPN